MKQIDFEFNINSILDSAHPREKNKYYLGANEEEQASMLNQLNLENCQQLYSHLPENILMENCTLPNSIKYQDVKTEMEELSLKNKIKVNFIGDGLQNYKTQEIVPYVSSLRNLVTAYTPYQPERSQGTLRTLWIYSNIISKLTGFEAVNASLYDRSTALYEATKTAIRLKRKKTVIICGILPQDEIVLKTLSNHSNENLIFCTLQISNGLINREELLKLIDQHCEDLAAIAFTQTNSLGHLEDMNYFTDLCHQNNLKSIAIIDPILLGKNGLCAPSNYGYGSDKLGCSMFVAEGQHLAIAPNFGGPGLGIFGIRYNKEDKLSIRQTAGRFIGKTVDSNNQEALCMILSTREQHIRREKATSNICSNQSFLASLAGASLLQRGQTGIEKSHFQANKNAEKLMKLLLNYDQFENTFHAPFYNEFTLSFIQNKESSNHLDTLDLFLEKLSNDNLNLGVNVSTRIHQDKQTNKEYLKLSCSDVHEESDFLLLKNLLDIYCTKKSSQQNTTNNFKNVITQFKRDDIPDLPDFKLEDIKIYYTKLNQLNMGTDESIYPLGSCTMKYNPFLNEYAASLPGFCNIHPQAPLKDVQGSLDVLYQIQEIFKSMTNLHSVTTQPLAGAQGELVGLKMIQAYHHNKNQSQKDIIIIPSSAHGTNPASACVAGFKLKVLHATDAGEINLEELKEVIADNSSHIAGMMVTNPNTSGIFERNFKEIANLIHSVDGLMYMDGANLNAIAGIIDLDKLGVDAIHSNLHKTFTIPHGGGGPGDAIVAVSEKLAPFLPGIQVKKDGEFFSTYSTDKSIGSFHRHFGNFAHKVRALTYLKVLGREGVMKMSSHAVLASNYLLQNIRQKFPILPLESDQNKRLHEFIITLDKNLFQSIEESGTPKAKIIGQIGKLFLDFGPHAPTVSFPEQYGLMIEPTESFSKMELDRFIEVLDAIRNILIESPELLKTAPHLTPVKNVNQVVANTKINLCDQKLNLQLSELQGQQSENLNKLSISEIMDLIWKEHNKQNHL